MKNNCRLSLFFNNHDNPRMLSKICPDTRYHEALAQLLAVLLLTLPGTPFLYQGDEMGLANAEFTSLSQITDVEVRGYCREHPELSEKELLKRVIPGTREHARILLPWNKEKPACHADIRQEINEKVREAYKQLLRLRKSDLCFAYGSYELLSREKDLFLYRRAYKDRSYIIEANLGKTKRRAKYKGIGKKLLFSNSKEEIPGKNLPPYGVRIWKER